MKMPSLRCWPAVRRLPASRSCRQRSLSTCMYAHRTSVSGCCCASSRVCGRTKRPAARAHAHVSSYLSTLSRLPECARPSSERALRRCVPPMPASARARALARARFVRSPMRKTHKSGFHFSKHIRSTSNRSCSPLPGLERGWGSILGCLRRCERERARGAMAKHAWHPSGALCADAARAARSCAPPSHARPRTGCPRIVGACWHSLRRDAAVRPLARARKFPFG